MTQERAILAFLDEIRALPMHAIHISLDGKVLARASFSPFSCEAPHRLFSVSKSCVSLAIGILLKDGKIHLDDPVYLYFPEYTDSSSGLLRHVTIRNMLTMQTCYAKATYRPLEDSNWTKTWFEAAPDHLPGTLFNYDTSASQVLCALCEKIAQSDILTFLEHRLFAPLGMCGEKRWLKDKSGTSQGGTGLIMNLDDFAALTSFFMTDGLGIVSPDYLKDACSPLVDTSLRTGPEERHGYGYQVWQTRHGFSLYGMAGQMGICIPEKKLVVCTFADTLSNDTGVQPIYDAVFRHLEDLDTLPSSDADRQVLSEQLGTLSLPAVSGDTRRTVRLSLQQDMFPFRNMVIGENTVCFEGEQTWSLPFAPGTWLQASFPQSGTPCFVTAAWTAENVFDLSCELTGDWTGCMSLRVVLKDSQASLQIVSRIWELLPGWNGSTWGIVEEL